MPSYPEYIQRSIDRLKAFEPPEGYFVAFSGGQNASAECYGLGELVP